MLWPSALDLVIVASFLTPPRGDSCVCFRCLAYLFLSSPPGWPLKTCLLPSLSSWQHCSLAGDVAQEPDLGRVLPLLPPLVAHWDPHTDAGSARLLFSVGDSGHMVWRLSWLSLSLVTSTLQPAPVMVEQEVWANGRAASWSHRLGAVGTQLGQVIRTPHESGWWHSPWATQSHHCLARRRHWLSEGRFLEWGMQSKS